MGVEHNPFQIGTSSGLSETRGAVLVAAFGLLLFGGFAAMVRAFDLLPFRGVPVIGIPLALAVLNLLLAAWPAWSTVGPWVAWIYEGFHALWLTVVLYFLGGLQLGAYLPVYGFLVVHTEILRPDASVFITANLCALIYGTLGWLEHVEVLVPPQVLDGRLRDGQRLAQVGFATLSFNFLAVYAYGHGLKLRALAGRLERMVQERTHRFELANRDLERTAVALREKQREYESFVYTVTHDLKGPLSSIVLMADMALTRDGVQLDDNTSAALERIRRSGQHTEDMIHDLLGLFRLTSAPEEPTQVDLDILVREALDELRPRLLKKETTVALTSLPVVWGQPRRLYHALSNVLDNAVKYVRHGRGRLTIGATIDDDDATVCIGDNGIGIPATYQARIFDVFGRVPLDEQQVDGVTVAGTGVGLAITREIVAAHGGQVWVQSAPDAGTSIFVRLPRRARA